MTTTLKTVTYTGPAPADGPIRLPNTTPCGTLHTPDPAAVERLRALMAQQPTRRWREAPRRQHNGSQIVANLQRAAEAGYARRRYVLSDAQYADVMARRESKEAWTRIAADYGVSHTTLMNATARYRAEQRKAEREAQQ